VIVSFDLVKRPHEGVKLVGQGHLLAQCELLRELAFQKPRARLPLFALVTVGSRADPSEVLFLEVSL
jgi:hypothetical protein